MHGLGAETIAGGVDQEPIGWADDVGVRSGYERCSFVGRQAGRTAQIARARLPLAATALQALGSSQHARAT